MVVKLSKARFFSGSGIGIILGSLVGILVPSESLLYAIDNSQIPQATNPASEILTQLGRSQKEAQESAARKATAEKNSAWITCFIQADSIELPCPSVIFVIKNSQQEEIRRVQTDPEGACTFSLPDDAPYTLVPLSKHYRVEPSEFHVKRGEHVTVHLRTF